MSEHFLKATMQTPDGLIFYHAYDLPGETVDHQKFQWTEGNYSCDCNRSIFAVDAGVMDHELDCSTYKNEIQLISLTIDGKEVL